MLGRKNKISLQFKSVVIASLALAICLFGLIAVYAKTTIWRNTTNRTPESAESGNQQQQPIPVVTNFFNPAGLPIQITTTAASNDKGATNLSYTITNPSGAEISSIDLALFDFNPAGKLMKAQVWSLQTDLGAGKSGNFSLRLRSRATPSGRLILSAEAVRGNADVSRNTATSWQVGLIELAQAIGVLVAGGKDISIQVAPQTTNIPELSGSAYCSDAFATAFQLSKLSDAKALASFTCDRTERTFVFGFNGKDLVQK